MMERVDVAIVGGGPAGLTAAAELARHRTGRVLVIEREREPGGIPRHADHPGFGLRDLHRALSGPAYAQRLANRAAGAGAEFRLSTQVTGWAPDGTLEVTSPIGRGNLAAGAIVLATGCRERPRSARLIPGDRPLGAVMTTGQLQQLVHLDRIRYDGRSALVVGAEHVAFSALQTLHEAGARTVAMITHQPRHQSFAAFALGARFRFRAPLHTNTILAEIHGAPALAGVTLMNTVTGQTQEISCDLVVLTGDWIPDHELAVLAGIRLDLGTRGPAVDRGGHTSRTGVFAVGNLLHGAETADLAALSGGRIATAVRAHLNGNPWPPPPVPISCVAPLHWLVPGPRSCRLRASEHLRDVDLEIAQADHVLARTHVSRVMPGRSATIAAGWLGTVDPAGPPVTVRVLRARRRSITPALHT
jgi:thioredoxin reductase